MFSKYNLTKEYLKLIVAKELDICYYLIRYYPDTFVINGCAWLTAEHFRYFSALKIHNFLDSF